MTNISKKPLSKKDERALIDQFVTLISKKTTKRSAPQIFLDLLTETERSMIVKRFAIVALLSQRQSTYAIAKALNVSDATVRNIQRRLSVGEMDSLREIFDKKSFMQSDFWDSLEVLLRAGMPSYGKGRWDSVNKRFG